MKHLNKLSIMLLISVLTTSLAFSQIKQDCKNTCIVEKTVHEGAFLGAKFNPNCGDKGVYIVEILPDSAIENSVLKLNDLVLSLNGTEIKHAIHLINLVATFEPFEQVNLVYERDYETYETKVVLGSKSSKIVTEEICCDELSFEHNVKVYPNPTAKYVNVSFNKMAVTDIQFQVYNINGVLLYSSKDENLGKTGTKVIDIEAFQDGVYVLKINYQEKTYSKMFVVKK